MVSRHVVACRSYRPKRSIRGLHAGFRDNMRCLRRMGQPVDLLLEGFDLPVEHAAVDRQKDDGNAQQQYPGRIRRDEMVKELHDHPPVPLHMDGLL